MIVFKWRMDLILVQKRTDEFLISMRLSIKKAPLGAFSF